MDDRYVPDYREDDDPSERRVRSPSRVPLGMYQHLKPLNTEKGTEIAGLEARMRPRTPNPYLGTELSRRIGETPPWAQRVQRQNPRPTTLFFEGLRYHCFSANEDGDKEARMMGARLRVSNHLASMLFRFYLTTIRRKEV